MNVQNIYNAGCTKCTQQIHAYLKEASLECPVCLGSFLEEHAISIHRPSFLKEYAISIHCPSHYCPSQQSLSVYHYFHTGCFERWNQQKKTCPSCRESITSKNIIHIKNNIYENEKLFHQLSADEWIRTYYLHELHAIEALWREKLLAIKEAFYKKYEPSWNDYQSELHDKRNLSQRFFGLVSLSFATAQLAHIYTHC